MVFFMIRVNSHWGAFCDCFNTPGISEGILDRLDDQSAHDFALALNDSLLAGAETTYRRLKRKQILDEADGPSLLAIFQYGTRYHRLNHMAFAHQHGIGLETLLNEENETALHLAAKRNWTKMIDWLGAHGANLEMRRKDGYTPLMVAVERCHYLALVYLQQLGADYDADIETEADGRSSPLTALDIAACGGDAKSTDYLCRLGANLEASSPSPLVSAIQFEKDEVVHILCKYGANLGTTTFNPLLEAVARNNSSAVTILCEWGAHEEKKGLDNLKKIVLRRKLLTQKDLSPGNTLPLRAAAKLAKKQENKKIAVILANADKIYQNAKQLRNFWTEVCKPLPDQLVIQKQLKKFLSCEIELLKSSIDRYLLQMASRNLVGRLLTILKNTQETDELLAKLMERLERMNIKPSASTFHAAVRLGLKQVVTTFLRAGLNPKLMLVNGRNAFHVLGENPRAFPEDKSVALLRAMKVNLGDAEQLFGVPYSEDVADSELRRAFRQAMFEKVAAHFNRLAGSKACFFTSWIKGKCKSNGGSVEVQVDSAIHLFLLQLFFQTCAIHCRGDKTEQKYWMRFEDTSSWEKVISLSQGDVNVQNVDTLIGFSSLIRQWSSILEELFDFDWHFSEGSLQARLGTGKDPEFEVKKEQLAKALNLLAQHKQCCLPVEMFQEGEQFYLRTTAALAAEFLKQKISYSSSEADVLRKLVAGIIKRESVAAVRLQGETTPDGGLVQTEARPSPANEKHHVGKPIVEGTKKMQKKGKKNGVTQETPQQPTSTVQVLKSGQNIENGALAHPNNGIYLDASDELLKRDDFLLTKDHQAITASVQTCFERLHELSRLDCHVPRELQVGARLFNWMLIDLVCGALPDESPLRDLCKVEERQFWALHCFPCEKKGEPLGLESVHESIAQALAAIKEGKRPDWYMHLEVKDKIRDLFSECQEFRLPWAQMLGGQNPDPRPLLIPIINYYLRVLRELSMIEGSAFALDATAFYVSRIGELIKHFEPPTKEWRRLYNEIGACFRNAQGMDRDTLHANCLALSDTILSAGHLTLKEVLASGQWKPAIRMNFHYSANLMAILLYWRIEELNEKGLKVVVLARSELADLHLTEQFIANAAESGYKMAIIPLKLPNKRMACLICHFDAQKIQHVRYCVVDAANHFIPKEVLEFTESYKIKMIAQPEKKKLELADHGPLLIERVFQFSAAYLKRDGLSKEETLLQMRKKHMLLALQHGVYELYWKQMSL